MECNRGGSGGDRSGAVHRRTGTRGVAGGTSPAQRNRPTRRCVLRTAVCRRGLVRERSSVRAALDAPGVDPRADAAPTAAPSPAEASAGGVFQRCVVHIAADVRRRRRRPMLCGLNRALERAPVGDTAGWTALLRRSPVLRRLVCLGALVSGARSRPGALERPPLGHRWQGQAGSGADCVRGSPVVRVRRSRSKWVQGRGWCLGRSWPAHPHLGTGTRHPFVLQRPVMYVAELMPGGR